MGPQRMYGLTVWVRRLLVANLLVFLVQKTLLIDPNIYKALGFDPLHVWEQPWTFLTYMFLHWDVPHLLFNMIMLFMFGASVEDRMGSRMFILFYLLCGVGGAALSFILMEFAPVGLILGASGAILGVAVAFAWYWPKHSVFVFPLPDPIPAKWLIIALVAFDLVLALLTSAGFSDPIAHLTHLGGVGTALLFLKAQEWRTDRGERRQTTESSVLVSQPPRVSRGGGIPPSARATKRGDTDARATAEIDRVLDKINASGVESLTPAERKFLTEISRRMRTPPKA